MRLAEMPHVYAATDTTDDFGTDTGRNRTVPSSPAETSSRAWAACRPPPSAAMTGWPSRQVLGRIILNGAYRLAEPDQIPSALTSTSRRQQCGVAETCELSRWTTSPRRIAPRSTFILHPLRGEPARCLTTDL